MSEPGVSTPHFYPQYRTPRKELPNIILEFLPAYSPNMNLIELVRHSCKEYIAHRLFQSTDELESLLKRLLNEGELTIK